MQLLYALGVLILLVLLWSALQWLGDYRRRLRLKLEPLPPGADIENRNPELGKVRIRPRIQPAFGTSPDAALSAQEKTGTSAGASSVRAEAMPLGRAERARPESATISVDDSFDASRDDALDENVPVLLTPVALCSPDDEIEQQDMFAHESVAPPPLRKNESLSPGNRASVLYETQVIEPVRAVTASAVAENPFVDVQDVIALHVVARGDLFNGEDLLRCVLGYGLRYGEMGIFHRHEQPTGQGRILFSMAQAVEPGTFDLEALIGEEIPGVSFFLSLPGVNSIPAYDIMVDTVKRLALDLQGDILDEQQQVLTRQLIEHYRERVQEFERRRLMKRAAR